MTAQSCARSSLSEQVTGGDPAVHTSASPTQHETGTGVASGYPDTKP
jgi:hypothetical protein